MRWLPTACFCPWALSGCCRRCPFALEKMRYDDKSSMVIYRSKLHATLKRNYQLMPALKRLRLLMNHIPDKWVTRATCLRYRENPIVVPSAYDAWDLRASAVHRRAR